MSKVYSDAAYVEGVYQRNPKMERELHKLCREYYEKNFHRPRVNEEDRKDIFQNSLLALWKNIQDRRLYVEDGALKGKDGILFTSTLTTYFMSIVNNKYMEWLRKSSATFSVNPRKESVPDKFVEEDTIHDFQHDDATLRKISIITNRISHMSKQCNKILTLFYYEEKCYDEMLTLLPTFKHKDALKTAKYKCLKRLYDSVNSVYLST